MATITKFTIKNFKGIKEAHIDLGSKTKNSILTLIGLNESGKTTILEALSHFVTSDRTNSNLFDGPYAQRQIAGFIPIHRQAAFTDNISISASVELNQKDKEKITKIFSDGGLRLEQSSIPNTINVKQNYKFVDSRQVGSSNYWTGLDFEVSKLKGKKNFKYVRPKDDEKENDLWLESVNYLRGNLPNVAYFPTFLVDLPSKIYLREYLGEKPVNRYYRNVLQDVLTSIDEALNIDNHIIKRINDFKIKDGTASWYSKFHSEVDRRNVESVFQKLSSAITKEVLGNWQRVFNSPVSAKQITIDWNIDTENDDIPYCTFNVSDGESLYQIDQRSLGFRWFFSFLLFTRFKASRERPTIFLFDEPAANLHARAQAQLLQSFERIVNDGNIVFYSTHSHHMIDPRWLTGAYIVENQSIDYDSDDYSTTFSVAATNIKVTGYREFVSHQPERTSYFQPVLERLQYQEPILVGSGSQIFLEGISDFYAFEYVRRKTKKFENISLVPGFGAGSLKNAISRALSEGRKFKILLDDDPAGKSAQSSYRSEWYLNDASVVTLGDFDSSLRGKKLEDIIGQGTKDKIKDRFEGKSGKKKVNYYLAEILSSMEEGGLDDNTFLAIENILIQVSEGLD